MKNEDDKLERDLGDMLRRSARAIDPAHAQALQAARRHALAARPATVWTAWGGYAAAAGVAIIAGLFAWSLQQSPGTELTPVAYVEDIEILMGDESLEMMAELDFYEWLSVEADSGMSDAPRRRLLVALLAGGGLMGGAALSEDDIATDDIDLLEFIGSWEGDDDTWLDALEVQDEDYPIGSGAGTVPEKADEDDISG